MRRREGVCHDPRRIVLPRAYSTAPRPKLIQAIEQMGRMQRILEAFRRDILPKNAKNFAVFAEGPLDEIRKLQAEINDYLTRLTTTEAMA